MSEPDSTTDPVVAEPVATTHSVVAEIAAVTFAAVAISALVVSLVEARVDPWLPLDAAHFVAEADWLTGTRGVTDVLHPPVFPALVAVADVVFGRSTGVLVAMAVACALYVVAVYCLLRQWHRPLVAAMGAVIGATVPVLAEIIGWGGGPNLLGFAAAIGALAAAEAWTSGRRAGPVAGALVGVALATHPLAAIVAAALVGGRVLWYLASRRRLRLVGWGPDSLTGWLTVVLAALPFAVGSAYYYLGVDAPAETTIGPPDITVLIGLVTWAGREHPLIVGLLAGALIAPWFLASRRSRPAAVTLASVVLIGSVVIRGDASYQSRLMYLMPALVAILVSDALPGLIARLAGASGVDRRVLVVAVPVVVVLFCAQVGFLPRLDVASAYYRRVTGDDLAALRSLEGTSGVVASSHFGRSTAEPTGWFVNAGAQRPSVSPIGPWLSTRPEEREAGQAMQQLFAGQVGAQNGAVQVTAAGTPEGFFQLQIAVRIDDWYFPVARLDDARTRWPFVVVSAASEQTADGVSLSLRGTDGARIRLDVALAGDTVVLDAALDGGALGDWHLVFSPGVDETWTPTRTDIATVGVSQSVSGQRVDFDLSAVAVGAFARATTYGSGQPVDFDAPGAGRVTIRWRGGEGVPVGGDLTKFDEASLLRRWGISRVVVWRNTGLTERFRSGCYRTTSDAAGITIATVEIEC